MHKCNANRSITRPNECKVVRKSDEEFKSLPLFASHHPHRRRRRRRRQKGERRKPN